MTQIYTDSEHASARDPETFQIIGAAMAVHSELGPGFLERVYQEAFIIELTERNIPNSSEVEVPINYKGNILDAGYRADVICFSNVILELKAASELNEAHMGQLINYLKATGYKRGLLFNFGASRLEYKRVVY